MSATEVKAAERGLAFGKYTLIAKLATGGMGEIFLARLSGVAGFEKLVVIKRLLPHLAEDAHFVAMLLDEARIAARLSHPNVCQVNDLGEVEGQYYIAMEYLEGVPISQILKRARQDNDPIDIRLAASLLQQTCDGLHHAHELKDNHGQTIGLVHRDVSPSNLFVTVDGAVKVLDFGVAKSQDALARTHTGALKGKYAYMSPEQVLTLELDRRSDVFSLGIVLFELLTSRRLFWRDSEYKMFQAIAEDPIPSVREFRPEVPQAIATVADRALSRDPGQRQPTAKALGEDLARALRPVGPVWTAAEIAGFVAGRFDAQLQERRDLVDSASLAAASRTPFRMPQLPSAASHVADFDEQIEVDTVDNRMPPGGRRAPGDPVGAHTADVAAVATRSGGWKLLAGLLLGGGIATAAALAYWQTRPAERPRPQVTIVQGGVDAPATNPASVPQTSGVTRVTAPFEPPVAAPAEPPAAEPPAEEPPAAEPAPAAAPAAEPPPDDAKPAPVTVVLARAEAKVRACAQRFPVDKSYQIRATFRINARGRVASPGLSSSELESTALGRCLLAEIRGLRFDRKEAGASIELPITLTARRTR